MPPTPASTSTPALRSKLPAAPRLGLRRKGAPLTGTRTTLPGSVVIADGSTVSYLAGDWLIQSGSIVLTVLPEKEFPGPYEIVQEGALIVDKASREAFEAVAGIGSASTPAAMIQAAQRLCRIAIGDVNIPFTPGQIEEIKFRAEKRGITVQRAIQDVIDRIKDELFHRG